MQHPKHFLEKLQIRPRKKWGQNFLVHENNVRSIVDFAQIAPSSCILEIGPGLGAMSELLIANAQQYTGVEFDPILHAHLMKTFASPSAQFIHQDILQVDLGKLFDGKPFCVVANLPYHITTPIVEKLLNERHRLTGITLLLQKEVVQRMIAGPGSKTYGRLSVWIQTLCQARKGPTLKPGCFLPQPDVDSQVIGLTPRKDAQIDDAFFDFVNKLFQKRRKTIGAIVKSHGYGIENLSAEIRKNRPENLSIQDMLNLFHTLVPKLAPPTGSE